MEKHAFSLVGDADRRSNVANGLFYVLIAGLAVYVFRSDPVGRYVWPVFLAMSVLLICVRYRHDRSSRIEVCDEGLVVTSWPLRQIVRVGWESITSVEVRENATLRRYGRPSVSATVLGNRGCVVRIPALCPDSEEIIGILRQRLPAELFEERR